MPTLTEAQIIRLMRDEYHQRLLDLIGESDMFDDKGNSLLSHGLKVRHKDSGLEYTVDSVEGEKDSGNVKITLRLPDEPRFTPPPQPSSVIADELPPSGVLGEDEHGDLLPASDPQDLQPVMDSFDDDTEFVIDQEEFEKEYEVT